MSLAFALDLYSINKIANQTLFFFWCNCNPNLLRWLPLSDVDDINHTREVIINVQVFVYCATFNSCLGTHPFWFSSGYPAGFTVLLGWYCTLSEVGTHVTLLSRCFFINQTWKNLCRRGSHRQTPAEVELVGPSGGPCKGQTEGSDRLSLSLCWRCPWDRCSDTPHPVRTVTLQSSPGTQRCTLMYKVCLLSITIAVIYTYMNAQTHTNRYVYRYAFTIVICEDM